MHGAKHDRSVNRSEAVVTQYRAAWGTLPKPARSHGTLGFELVLTAVLSETLLTHVVTPGGLTANS